MGTCRPLAAQYRGCLCYVWQFLCEDNNFANFQSESGQETLRCPIISWHFKYFPDQWFQIFSTHVPFGILYSVLVLPTLEKLQHPQMNNKMQECMGENSYEKYSRFDAVQFDQKITRRSSITFCTYYSVWFLVYLNKLQLSCVNTTLKTLTYRSWCTEHSLGTTVLHIT